MPNKKRARQSGKDSRLAPKRRLSSGPTDSGGQAPTARSGAIENRTIQGIGLMLLGIGALTLNDAFMKSAVEQHPLGPSLFLRSCFSAAFLILFLAVLGRVAELRWSSLKNQVISGIYMVLSTAMFVYALRGLPLSTATVIIYVSPLVVTALAPLMLQEHVGWRRYAAVAVGFAGVVIVIRPGFTEFRPELAAALGGAIVIALRDILTRKMISQETSYSIILFSALFCCLAYAPWSYLLWDTDVRIPWMLLGFSALSFTLAQFLIAEAFRRANASVASPFKYSGVIYAGIIGFLLWGEVPDQYILIGASMIVGSGVFIVLRERRIARSIRQNRAPPPSP